LSTYSCVLHVCIFIQHSIKISKGPTISLLGVLCFLTKPIFFQAKAKIRLSFYKMKILYFFQNFSFNLEVRVIYTICRFSSQKLNAFVFISNMLLINSKWLDNSPGKSSPITRWHKENSFTNLDISRPSKIN